MRLSEGMALTLAEHTTMKAVDLALGILVTIIWGSNFSVIEIGLQNLEPNVLTTMRFALSAFPLIFFVKRPNVSLTVIAAYGTIFGVGLWWVVNLAMSKECHRACRHWCFSSVPSSRSC